MCSVPLFYEGPNYRHNIWNAGCHYSSGYGLGVILSEEST